MSSMDANQKKYPYLPEGREILYVPEADPFMTLAKDVHLESNDLKNPTGAVVVKNGEVVSSVSNKNPLNNKFLINLHKKFCIRRFLKIPTGKYYGLCPGCAGYETHAERRAVDQALDKGIDINGADLYLYGHWWCCKPCWDSMIKAGIKNVYLVEGAEEMFKRK